MRARRRCKSRDVGSAEIPKVSANRRRASCERSRNVDAAGFSREDSETRRGLGSAAAAARCCACSITVYFVNNLLKIPVEHMNFNARVLQELNPFTIYRRIRVLDSNPDPTDTGEDDSFSTSQFRDLPRFRRTRLERGK